VTKGAADDGNTSSYKRPRTEQHSANRQNGAFSQPQQFTLKSWFNVSVGFCYWGL
jgi:hypothetical protein